MDGVGIRLLHAGSLCAGRYLRPPVEAIRLLVRENGTHEKQIGLGRLGPSEDDAISDEISERGLGSIVEMQGHVPYARAKREMRDATTLVLLDSPSRRVGVPAKLYEYIGAQRPILAMAEEDSDVGSVLATSCSPYRIVAPSRPTAIRDAILELQREPGYQEERSDDACDESPFTREAVTGRLSEFLSTVVREVS